MAHRGLGGKYRAEHLFQRLLEIARKEAHRGEVALKIAVNAEGKLHNLEAYWHQATERLSRLSYFVDLMCTVVDEEKLVPKRPAGDGMGYLFFDYEALSAAEAKTLNEDVRSWAFNQVFRDLSEVINIHLLNIYEYCLLLENGDTDLSLARLEELVAVSSQFERKGIRDRFKVLRKDHKVRSAYTGPVSSLYDARNIFAHFDGVVQRKYCDQKGNMSLVWPVNSAMLRKRATGKLIPYNKATKPFSGEEYSEVVVKWLGESKLKKFKLGDTIVLDAEELHGLIFLYMHVLKELQLGLIDATRKKGYPARDFEVYGLNISFAFSEDAE